MTYWQVAAGADGRDYSCDFLRYGVMLIGPGGLGHVGENRESYKKHSEGANVLRFADKVKCGDHVILKRPYHKQWHIVAVGCVTGEYEWLEQFEDVEGWDLQHSRRVKWVKANPPVPVNGLTQGRINRVSQSQKEPIDAAKRLMDERDKDEAIEVPPPVDGISEEHLGGSLIENGSRHADAEAVIRAIGHVRRLAGWYNSQRDEVSEDDVRTFLIIPLLEALGWTPKQIKLERAIGRKRADISLFQEEFRKDSKASVILEVKRMGMGLDRAERQIRKYADECNMLLTSTGDRYWLYKKNLGEPWDARSMKGKHLSAYMNLFKLRDRHPYLENVGGAPDLLKSLMPG